MWYNTKNQLTFFNGLKMKTSVTIGVIQMVFGITLSLFNHIYFHDIDGIIFEFIPQMVFILCTFGYMIFIIIYKFCVDWSQYPGANPPNLIQTMINLFLSPGHVDNSKRLYTGQEVVQGLCLLFAFVSVPVMLLGRPCRARCRHHGNGNGNGHGAVEMDQKKEEKVALGNGSKAVDFKAVEIVLGSTENKSPIVGNDEGMAAGVGKPSSDSAASSEAEGDHSFGDLMIHQAIHTIEYVLGTVSNTASYLRLWALSLAHSELAEVFWSKLILQYGVYQGNPIFPFITFAIWVGVTVGVLLMMDVLECFLHALRLHWVEFQNKFFRADGYAFQPFNYDKREEAV